MKFFQIRVCAVLLAVCMLAAGLPAAAAGTVQSGKCGDNLTWTLDAKGTLTIRGSGMMTDYEAGESPFYKNADIKSLVMENGATSVGAYAFAGCTGLKNVSLPNDIGTIFAGAFSDCTGLTAFRFPTQLNSLEDFAFYGCTGLTSLQLPESLFDIEQLTFAYCTGLTSLTLPDGLYFINCHAFSGCTGIKEVYVGEGLSSMGIYVFEGCSGLEKITVNKNNLTYHSAGNCLIETDRKLLVRGCKNSVIPTNGSVTALDCGAFEDCTGLTSITIPGQIGEVPPFSFRGCTDLQSVTLSQGVERIGMEAFCKCEKLESITLADSVYEIGEHAFLYTPWLAKQPEGPVYAGKVLYTYKGEMPDETTLEVKNGTVGIAEKALANCENLKDVSIPDSVISVGRFAFRKTPWLNNQPDGLVYAGRVAYTYKGEMSENTELTLKEGTLGISPYAFESCAGLTGITIPDSVQTIGEMAFYFCTNLKSIAFPEGITHIGKYMFNGCRSLETITVPKSVTRVEGYAFARCTGLRTVYYSGTKSQWQSIVFEEENGNLYYEGSYIDTFSHEERKPLKFCFGDTHTHVWDAGVVTQPPGENNEGERTYTCTVCGETKTEPIPREQKGSLAPFKKNGVFVYTLNDVTAAELVNAIGLTAIVLADGRSIEDGEKLASGMTLFSASNGNKTIVVMGDVDGDGAVSAADARIALRIAVNLETPEDWQTNAALVSGEKTVSAADARLILRAAVSLEKLQLT